MVDARLRRDDDEDELTRLRDEVEQLRTALETSAEQVDRLAEDRDRLLRRVTSQARDLQAMNAANQRVGVEVGEQLAAGLTAQFRSAQEGEELRVAFEELQVLTEELEVANTSLHEANRVLDSRVEARTRELETKNAALVKSELRFRVLMEGIPQLVWRAVGGGHWTWASPQWTEFTGQPEAESHGWGWLQALHPTDRDPARKAWATAVETGRLQADYRVRRASDGAYCWFQTRATPVRDESGCIVEWLGASTDVQEMRALQDRQRVLLHELQHRVRNTLSVVRSLAKSTSLNSETVEDFAFHLEGRLSALARTQMVLTRAPVEGVDLENMVREELLAQAARDQAIEVAGPEVRLSAKAAEVLTLAVHELATNSVKYGALGVPEGHVVVQWSQSEQQQQPWVTVIWQESGVRMASAAPRREGFGTELIEMRVPYELEGRGALQFHSGGVRCEIAFPLTPGDSILQTDAPSPTDREG